MTDMILSTAGADFIKSYETLELNAYDDGVGVWTIGWGHTQGVEQGDSITLEQAEQYFQQDISSFVQAVNQSVTADLTQNQFDALVSLSFNIGATNFANSTLVRLLSEGDFVGAEQQFHRWKYANKVELQGLILRRADEAQMFSDGDYDRHYSGDTSSLEQYTVEVTPVSYQYNILDAIEGSEGALLVDFGVDENGNAFLVWAEENGNITRQTGAFDSQNNLNLLTQTEYFNSSDAVVTKTYNQFDNNNQPLGDGDLSIEFNGTQYNGELAGQLFGSQLGSVIADGDFFAEIGLGTLGSVIAGNAAEFVGTLGQSWLADSLNLPQGETILSVATESTFNDFGADFTGSLALNSATALSSLLLGEVAEAVGLDGFDAQVFTSTGASVSAQLVTNIQGAAVQGVNLDVDSLMNAIENIDLINAFGASAGALFGSTLTDEYLNVDSVGEALFTSVGGSYAALTYGSAFGSGVGSALTGLTASSALSTTLGAILLPGVGALIGTVLGQTVGSLAFDLLDEITDGWLGDLFDTEHPWHYLWTGYNETTNQMEVVYDDSDDTVAADREGTQALTDIYLQTVNRVIETVGGKVDTFASDFNFVELLNPGPDEVAIYDHAYIGYHHSDGGTNGGNDNYRVRLGSSQDYVNLQPGEDPLKLVRIAAEYQLSKMVFADGDSVKLRAFENWKDSLGGNFDGNSIDTLLSTMQIAEDYSRYLENTEAINALLIAAPDTAFSTGWVSSLLQAEAMELNEGYKIGFFGGAEDATASIFADNIITADGDDEIFVSDGDDTVRAFAGKDTINGGGGSDIIDAGDGDDQLWGEAGDDSLIGGDGDDILNGAAGADTLEGGRGIDAVTYSNSAAAVIVSLAGAIGIGGDAQGDVIRNVEKLIGSDFADNLSGSDRKDVINGGTGGDTIDGGENNDEIYAEDGNDLVLGGAGDDKVWGWTGDDTIYGGDGDDQLSGEQDLQAFPDGGDGSAPTMQGSDMIYGGAGNDLIIGDDPTSQGADHLFGEAGNDTLVGGAGADTLDGGEGDDSLFGGDDGDIILGGAGNDIAFGDNGSDSIEGGADQDSLLGGDGNDTLVGGLGNDSLYGDFGNDVLLGGDGVDELFGFDGDDSLDGGDGNDILAGEDGNDTIQGGNGDDVIYSDGIGASGQDFVDGGAGDDLIKAGVFADTVFGGLGDDLIFGEGGDDLLSGGSGNDTLNGGLGHDDIFGGEGNDQILAYEGNDVLSGEAGDDLLYGLSGNDTILGGDGEDILYGDSGDDLLQGNNDNDFIDGWYGTDTLEGGSGDDTLIGGAEGDNLQGGDGNDLIYGGLQPNPNPLPATNAEILGLIPNNPGYESWGLLYQGEGYTLSGLQNAAHDMLIINPAADSISTIPSSETAWTAAEISQIKADGKALFGYVNLAKVNSSLSNWESGWTSNGLADGVATSNAPAWLLESESALTRHADFTQSGFHDFVFERLDLMINQGFDGTLLDDVLQYYFQIPQGLAGNDFLQAAADKSSAMRDFVVDIRDYVDTAILARDGFLDASNRFGLVVNGAPFIMADTMVGEHTASEILAVQENQDYLNAINMILVENYFARAEQGFIDYTKELYGDQGVLMISVDTDQVTEQQRITLYQEAVEAGFLPFATENARYDTLNDPFLIELNQTAYLDSADTIFGGAGQDTVISGLGADYIELGGGNDQLVISAVSDSSYADGVDLIGDFTQGEDQIDVSALGYSDISSLQSTYNASGNFTEIADAGTGFALAFTGNLTLTHADFIFDTETTDPLNIITGTAASEVIAGTADADRIISSLGADTVTGGGGADLFDYTELGTSVRAGNLQDTITDFTVGVDQIDLSGLGFTGLDIEGATGVGSLRVAYTSTGGGRTKLRDWDGDTDFEMFLSGDLTGTLSDSDFIFDGNGNPPPPPPTNTITGTAASETITGTSGDDLIMSSLGADTITGGGGADLFDYTELGTSVRAGNLQDTITDFTVGVDQIDLSGLGFTGLDIEGATGVGSLRVAYTSTGGGRTKLRDWDGDTDFEMFLSGDLTGTLSASDFVF